MAETFAEKRRVEEPKPEIKPSALTAIPIRAATTTAEQTAQKICGNAYQQIASLVKDPKMKADIAKSELGRMLS